MAIVALLFLIGRGCRQGNPIPPYLFFYVWKISVVIYDKNNNDIKDIRVTIKDTNSASMLMTPKIFRRRRKIIMFLLTNT